MVCVNGKNDDGERKEQIGEEQRRTVTMEGVVVVVVVVDSGSKEILQEGKPKEGTIREQGKGRNEG